VNHKEKSHFRLVSNVHRTEVFLQ